MFRFKNYFLTKKENAFRFYFVIMAMVLLASILKDIAYSVPLPSDLRNRIVGARMMKNGLSPYFYICKTGGPIQYENIFTEPDFVVSQSTASPFFHSVFSLVADLPQFQLDIFWMLLEYMALIGCSLLAILSLPQQYRKKALPLVLAITVAFTFTTGWRLHIWNGQNYIFIPLLAMGSFYFLTKNENLMNIIIFAIFTAAMVLIRPVAILFYLPLFFYPKNYFKYGLATFLVITAYVLFVYCSPVQKTNWADYFKAIPIHITNNQHLYQGRPVTNGQFLPVTHFEGIDLKSGVDLAKMDGLGKMAETSNLYYFYNKLTANKLSINAMTYIGLGITLLLLLPIAWCIKKGINISSEKLMVLGFVIYNFFTFCAPLPRFNYYWVEFLFPLLLLATGVKNVYILPIVFWVVGVCLNFPARPWLPGKQNIGEFLIVIALLHFVYRPIFVPCLNEQKWKIKNGIFWL